MNKPFEAPLDRTDSIQLGLFLPFCRNCGGQLHWNMSGTQSLLFLLIILTIKNWYLQSLGWFYFSGSRPPLVFWCKDLRIHLITLHSQPQSADRIVTINIMSLYYYSTKNTNPALQNTQIQHINEVCILTNRFITMSTLHRINDV